MLRVLNKYHQNKDTFYSTLMTFEELEKISRVALYGDEDGLGYQRKININHLNSMVKSIRNNDNISPSSIMLGVDSEYLKNKIINENFDNFNEYLPKNSSTSLMKLDISRIDKNNHPFRIIDGQHRLKAVKEYISNTKDSSIKDNVFNVVIFEVSSFNKTQEVDIFSEINSKTKRLRTDLSMMAKYNIELKYNKSQINYVQHITLNIIISLNSKVSINGRKNQLFNSVKINPNDYNPIGITSIVSLFKAIQPFVKEYYNSLNKLEFKDYEETKNFVNRSSDYMISNIIFPMWDIVFKKWSDSIINIDKIDLINDFDDNDIYFYNKNSYIQQTMGIRSIFGLLFNIFKNNKYILSRKDDVKKAIDEFYNIIINSNLSSNDWKKGGLMTGLSSESGFKKIQELISNKG